MTATGFQTTYRRKLAKPVLRFTPAAWAKLIYLRDYGDTEVGFFGVSSDTNLLLVESLKMIKQECSSAYVAFDDDAVADFFDDMVDAGLPPERFGRIWIHTHPGSSASPSTKDEETFSQKFGSAGWSIMFILARGGQTYCRLHVNSAPAPYEIEIECGLGPGAQDASAWETEYNDNLSEETHTYSYPGFRTPSAYRGNPSGAAETGKGGAGQKSGNGFGVITSRKGVGNPGGKVAAAVYGGGHDLFSGLDVTEEDRKMLEDHYHLYFND